MAFRRRWREPHSPSHPPWDPGPDMSEPSPFESQHGAREGVRRSVAGALFANGVLLACAALLACGAPSQQDMQSAQALEELGASYNDLRQVQQQLQDQVDSLRIVVARQDSVIRTLANLAGVQMHSR